MPFYTNQISILLSKLIISDRKMQFNLQQEYIYIYPAAYCIYTSDEQKHVSKCISGPDGQCICFGPIIIKCQATCLVHHHRFTVTERIFNKTIRDFILSHSRVHNSHISRIFFADIITMATGLPNAIQILLMVFELLN